MIRLHPAAVLLVLPFAACSAPSQATRPMPVRMQENRTSFLTRLDQDCRDGDRSACTLLNSLGAAWRARDRQRGE